VAARGARATVEGRPAGLSRTTDANGPGGGEPCAGNFCSGCAISGYVEGRHFKMEDRSAGGRLDRLPALASELARLPVDMFVVGGEATIRAAMQASDKIPIVMTLAPDPVASGFVSSLARPGGNVTGMSALAPDLAGKRVELLYPHRLACHPAYPRSNHRYNHHCHQSEPR
jgi:putative ABC transport system substrate-binding protein